MRLLNRLIWATLIAGTTATPIFAQAGGSPGGSSGGASMGGSAGGSSGGSAGGTSLSGTTLSTLGSTPQITAPAAVGSASQSSLSSSNFFSPYFANPYYQGVLSNSSANNNNPGGFGLPLFSGSGGSSGYGGTVGSAAGTGGATSTAGRVGGISSRSSSSTTSATVIASPYQFSYRAEARFPISPVPQTQLQSEIINMIARSRDYPVRDLQVSADASVVTVRGIVKDEETARTIGSMVRLTAGVKGVKNELLFPVATKQP
jgi:hypothetical protein